LGYASLAGFASLGGCLTETREETHLRLQLHDSLARYDSVEIALVDVVDTSKVLAVLYNDPILNPGNMDPIPLPPQIREGGFQVRIKAWRFEDQVGVLMYLSWYNGQMVIVRNDGLEPLTPFSRALVSIENFFVGIWTPQWPIDSGITDYGILVALNIDSVQIYPGKSDARAEVYVDSQLFVPSEPIYKQLALGVENVVRIAVLNNARERVYTLRFRRDPKAGPHLTRLRTNGTMNPIFHPDSLTYSVNVSPSDNTLQFFEFNADPGSQAYLNAQLIPTDSLPQPQPLISGLNTFEIRLMDGFREQYYQLNVMKP
jgi:hypothetical protein